MAQTTTNLGKIHVFPSETLYNQFKDIIADNDLALLKDDGAYIVAALLEQNGYVKFSNGLILQWGTASGSRTTSSATFPLKFNTIYAIAESNNANYDENVGVTDVTVTGFKFRCYYDATIRYIAIGK